MKLPKIVAHRGISSLWPENSLIAFQKAIELGADSVECDVRRTLDGKLVVIHDPMIDRTTTGTGLVCRMTLDQIRQYPLTMPDGQEGSRICKDQKTPTFDEFLDLLGPAGVELRIEIKEAGFEKSLVEKITDHHLQERATLISFLPTALSMVKQTNQSIKTSLLTHQFTNVQYNPIRHFLNGVDIEFGSELNLDMYNQARRDGLTLDFWTIDDLDPFRQALKWEPDYVTSNFPQRLMKELGRTVPDWATEPGVRS
ncbi:MAG: glycerophosphodiester phosphodiesterase family protein [Phycisphaerae bacterium]